MGGILLLMFRMVLMDTCEGVMSINVWRDVSMLEDEVGSEGWANTAI